MKRVHRPLRAPEVPIDADIRWVLLAAFAERYPDPVRPGSPERAARLIETFSLVNQVASRLTLAQLTQALTPEIQRKLSQNFRNRVMRSLAVAQTRELVCASAEEASIDIALLKQSALEALKLASPQQRYATDVDVLLRPKDLFLFSAALERRGLTIEKSKRHAHGVPVFRTESGIGVELHVSLVDLRFGSSQAPVTFDSLQARGLLALVDAQRSHVFAPALELIAAHLTAQGWYLFHYVPNAPGHKSPFRVIADLGLLGLQKDQDLAARTYELILHEVPEDEYFGLISLYLDLSKGNLEELREPSLRLLSHAVASQIDAHYRLRLQIPKQLDAIRKEGMLGYAMRQVGRLSVRFPHPPCPRSSWRRGE